MEDLDEFTRGYIVAALWSSNDTEDGGEPLDQNYDGNDIAPDSLAQIKEDCEQFQRENAELLAAYYTHGFDAEQAGHDFWLTRVGHGVGFWDRDLDDLGAALTAAAHKAGERWLLVGDDGALHYER